MSQRFPLIFTQRRVLWVALVVAGAGALVAPSVGLRALCVVVALGTIVVMSIQSRGRPTLILDDAGYAVEERGREKLRVPWSDVQKVKVDNEEHALYVDTGDPARNLLVPPARGYGFRFARSEAICALVKTLVPDRIEQVDSLVHR